MKDVKQEDVRQEDTGEQARPAATARAAKLTALPPEEVRALSPEGQAEWVRQCRDEEADYDLLTRFLDALYPLARRHHKACRDNELGGGLDAHGEQKAWAALTDHLLSLPKFSKRDPGWLARVRRQQRRIKALYRAGAERRKADKRAGKAGTKAH